MSSFTTPDTTLSELPVFIFPVSEAQKVWSAGLGLVLNPGVFAQVTVNLTMVLLSILLSFSSASVFFGLSITPVFFFKFFVDPYYSRHNILATKKQT